LCTDYIVRSKKHVTGVFMQAGITCVAEFTFFDGAWFAGILAVLLLHLAENHRFVAPH
jgi:hypothetical protein